ncbi:glucose/mannose-6-phosphate isomerase [Murinocardiopsis flavida]|uniref:Glucose/mannose-6-phosphate isomerase n=1 Tax=Murinocardiopsis flavida TaxID=645275 RepID=A0A2P8DIT4_9ACTN|nr:SIS domain-containing protein [Murinocardiopsis flavida]PSK97098.1 glucose/mannose-6-phosphate isomerase [Murinocardiopsis flavida]
MPLVFEEHRLGGLAEGGDPAALEALRATASGAARLRSARSAALEADLGALTADGRPRSIVVVAADAPVGEAPAAVFGNGCPVPLVAVRDHRLPGWVAGHDLVIAVAATSGQNADPVARAAAEAVRRGCRFLGIGAPGGPLAPIAEQARAPYIPLHAAGAVAADIGPALWGPLAAVLTAVGRTAGITAVPAEVFEAAAARLEDVAHQCRPAAEPWIDPAKSVTLDLAGALPLIWGGTPIAAVAARRFAATLGAQARYPALAGEVPGDLAWQAPTAEGPFGGDGAPRSIFDDPEPEGAARMRAVLLRDPGGPGDPGDSDEPSVSGDSGGSGAMAGTMTAAEESLRARGVGISELRTEPGHPLERLAGLIALTEYVTVYLAVAYGVDPLSSRPVVP